MMKISDSPLLAFLIRWVAIAIILVVVILVFELVYGYAFVILEPQYATLENSNSIIVVEGITINGQRTLTANNQWEINLDRPKKNLSGIEQIEVSQNGIEEAYYISFIFCPRTSIPKNNAQLGINNEKMALGIYVSQNGKGYWNEVQSYINKRMFESEANPCEESIPTKEIASGEIILNEFQQSIKHLTLKGSLRNISAKLIGKDENDSIILTIGSLDFSIDSPVIYKWSNKAGKTWRL